MTLSPLTRRGFLAGTAACASRVCFAAGAAPSSNPIRSLGKLASDKGLLFGASFAVSQLDGPMGDAYARPYELDAHILTSELEFKLQTLRPKPDQIDFADADRLLDFAEQHAMKVRGHTLIWNDALPDWIKTLSPADCRELLDMHIETVTTRYGNRVGFWDVVNEPIGPWDKNPGNLRGGAFYAAYGEDYIDRAFQIARRFAPTATLVLNEAQTETADDNGTTFRTSLLSLLKRLKDKGTPIDAIGIQSHLRTAARYDFPAFGSYLAQLADMGFAIHITELDVNDTGAKGSFSERDRQVANLYSGYLNEVLKLDAVKIVELWQLSDASSWLRDPSIVGSLGVRPGARPLIYDDHMRKKPAWDAIAAAFENAPRRQS